MAFSIEPGIYLVGRVRRTHRGHRRVRPGRPDRSSTRHRASCTSSTAEHAAVSDGRRGPRWSRPAVSSVDGSRPMRPRQEPIENHDHLTPAPDRRRQLRPGTATPERAADEPPPSRPTASSRPRSDRGATSRGRRQPGRRQPLPPPRPVVPQRPAGRRSARRGSRPAGRHRRDDTAAARSPSARPRPAFVPHAEPPPCPDDRRQAPPADAAGPAPPDARR